MRRQKEKVEETEAMVLEKPSIDEMPLETIRDYRLYNEEARKINKKLRVLKYPIKQCPVELHPTQRVVFSRNDQPTNALPVHVSNHLIHFEQTLIPGQTYDLPECIITHLSSKGYPVWNWVENPDGTRETKISNKKPRFAIRTLYEE